MSAGLVLLTLHACPSYPNLVHPSSILRGIKETATEGSGPFG